MGRLKKQLMKNQNILLKLAFMCFLLTLYNCRDPFDAETNDFESILVIEATITNELIKQEILLSRTYVLEEEETTLENNATVWIEDDQNNTYTFSQNIDGNYLSDVVFQAVPDNNYTLYVTTQDGKNYQSSSNNLTPISQINSLYPEYISENQEVHVLVDSNNDNDATYFRYEYEETYKVIPPYYYRNDLILTNYVEGSDGYSYYDRAVVLREQEEETCYSSNTSIGIIQTSTSELQNNNISRFAVRKLDKENSVLRDRYSILVKQYVQNLEAYTFYKIIDELGAVQSILSANQPGYVAGNIRNTLDIDEKILGYFEVSSVSEKRIYFNHQDVGIDLPPWFYFCDLLIYDFDKYPGSENYEGLNERKLLYNTVQFLDYKLVSFFNTYYTVVNPQCSDCTSFSSNIVPDFWED